MWEGIFFSILFVGGSICGRLLQNRERVKGWEDAALSCGLRIVEGIAGWHPRLRARAGLTHVDIESFATKGQLTRIVIKDPGPSYFQSLSISAERALTFGQEIEIGDRRFDDAFFIDGPAGMVLELLDAEARRLLLDLKEKCDLKISSGELRAVLSHDGRVAEVLPLLLEVRRRFGLPTNTAQRLAENANRDPEPGVRLQNLLFLIREHSGRPETAKALHQACSDPSPEIRLHAATALGARGILLELLENLDHDAISAEAVQVLDRELPFERVSAILNLALRRRRLHTARACLEVIGRGDNAAGIDLLAKVMEREHGEVAAAAADALGATGRPAAEPSLIRALEREDTDLQVAAAYALARIGSAAAVLPLKEAAERSRLDELRRAARQAIAEIQSRAEGASPGQLSLAGTEAGQLSLAQSEEGQLSLAEDPAGRLSLPPGDEIRAEIQSRVQGTSPGPLSLAGTEADQLSLAQADEGQLSLAEDPAGRLSLPSGEIRERLKYLDTLLQLAESLEDDEASARAVSALKLKRELPFERVNAILDLALRRRRLRTAHACLEALAENKVALAESKGAAIDKLAKVLEREHGELALKAAWALGETGKPAAEPPLIQALQRDNLNLRKAAADALGRVGSLTAVLPLAEAGEDSELSGVTRQAIAEIQSRLRGASPGQLSLAGAEAGQLSLAQSEEGQLSLADDPAGQLSIRDGEDPGARV